MTFPRRVEPYPDEWPKIQFAYARLEREFEFTPLTELTKRQFENACHNEMGKAGFVIQIAWSEILDEAGKPTGVLSPILQFIDRTDKESETDHDRIRHGVVKGLDGGTPGYVREDGTVSEEPRKKNIV